MNDNLPELRDIHLPDGVSIWPPAYGWFVLILGIMLLYGFYHCWKKWRQASRKLYALRLLQELDLQKAVASGKKISELLRRICIYHYPEAVALEGQQWIDFIVAHGKGNLSDKSKELLLNAPYMPQNNKSYTPETAEELQQYIQRWIGENL